MPIPSVNVTVLDGALGSVPPSVANIHVKIGVCSLATASVAASKLIGSTTGGDGVTFTALTTGAGGNLINVTYATPSGGTTTVSVTGNAITVNPKTGETNAGVVTAVQASGPASALVTVAAVVGTDLVIAVAQTFLSGGFTGTINTLFSETNPTQVITDLGYGPLTEAVVHSLNIAGGQVYAMPINASIAGTFSVVSKVGSAGVGVLTLTGAPFDSYTAIVTIVATGGRGVGTFTYSLDNGKTTSNTFTIPSGGTYLIPSTGITLNFSAATFGATDFYTFSATSPGFSVADAQNALNALFALPQTWGFVHIVGPAATSAGAASLAAAVDVLMGAQALANNPRYAHAIIEVPQDTDVAITTAFGSTQTSRTTWCAGFETVASAVAQAQLIRNCAFSVAARRALKPIAEDDGRFASGNLPGVTSIARDESVTPNLDALSFTTLRTFGGVPGFYITSGHMGVPTTSDYYLSQNRQVMDLGCTVGRQALLQFLNDTIRVNKNNPNAGAITNANATTIESYVNFQLAQALVGPGFAVAASIVIDRTVNLLSTRQLTYTVRITPNGYAKTIQGTFALFNPALQIQAST